MLHFCRPGRNLDVPAGRFDGRAAYYDVAPRFDHGSADSVPLEGINGFVTGIALGDSAEVQAHAGNQQAGGPVPIIQEELAPTDPLAGLPELGFAREDAVFPRFAPELDE